MSTSEILAELPKLSPEDLEAVWSEAGGLLERYTLVPSSALLTAIEAGDASLANEPSVTLDEARRRVRSWSTA
jgi:hypothetical protein